MNVIPCGLYAAPVDKQLQINGEGNTTMSWRKNVEKKTSSDILDSVRRQD